MNTETKPADQVRADVLAELVARTGLPQATLTLVVPAGTMLVRAMAAALGPDVANKLDMLRFVVEGWHFRDRDEWQPAVQHARNLAKQLELPWDERLTTVEIPRRSGEKLQRLKAPRPLPFARA